ncbi:MAG: hypothetical protein COY40_07050 [Alphaproteobacteria bacterium CG_4_10_14_0_8_um_filter_53_9]|nr:MAG: hypothetical protein COY40_07050 [Alphaproteobacteria bacterium CG_4_10_14_0_8_um_filter_53_9]
MKLHYLAVTGLCVLSFAPHALETSASSGSDQNALKNAKIDLNNQISIMQATITNLTNTLDAVRTTLALVKTDNDLMKSCGLIGKIYFPTGPNADANGCSGVDLSGISLQTASFDWPKPAGSWGASMTANDEPSRQQTCKERGYSMVTGVAGHSYSSPGNNGIIRFVGGTWVLYGAKSFNSGIRTITCQRLVYTY